MRLKGAMYVEEYIQAMKEVKKKYEDRNVDGKRCAMCAVARDYYTDELLYAVSTSNACRKAACPWIIFCDRACFEDVSPVYRSNSVSRINKRIKQIDKWIAHYERLL